MVPMTSIGSGESSTRLPCLPSPGHSTATVQADELQRETFHKAPRQPPQLSGLPGKARSAPVPGILGCDLEQTTSKQVKGYHAKLLEGQIEPGLGLITAHEAKCPALMWKLDGS